MAEKSKGRKTKRQKINRKKIEWQKLRRPTYNISFKNLISTKSTGYMCLVNCTLGPKYPKLSPVISSVLELEKTLNYIRLLSL